MNQSAGDKELRLALVLYGGVSLAIYMHGITKEIQKLVHASRALDLDPETNPFAEATTEHVYWETLSHLARTTDPPVRTRVVVDVIAGTSAGGINGIYLAKALAQNADQRELRDLWIDKGDIGNLVRGNPRVPFKVRMGWFLMNGIRHPTRNEPVLRGDVMSVWFHDALKGMDAAPPLLPGAETLMPDDHDLQLFVTVTDFYGYNVRIPITSPREIGDWRRRHVLEFRRSASENQFTPKYDAGLAFAARATSSFPGAFPAISFAEFASYFQPPLDFGDFGEEFCRVYSLSGASASKTHFIDGGVLNNFPFDHAIRAIRQRSASSEVDRRLIYLQPDPGGTRALPSGEAPGWLATMWGGIAAIPAKEPILDDLLGVIKLNERVRSVREIIETSFPPLREQVAAEGDGLQAPLANNDADGLLSLRRSITAEANSTAGPGYPTYVRIKIRSVADCLAAVVNNVCDYPDESNHAFFVRTLLSEWAEAGELFKRELPPTERQVAFLKAFDLPFAERLLRFVIAAVSWLYRDVGKDGSPDRAQLDKAKAYLYGELAKIQALMDGSGLDEESKQLLRATFDQDAITAELTENGLETSQFLAERHEQLDAARTSLEQVFERELGDFDSRLMSSLLELTAGWKPEVRRDLFVRHLGFQLWDILLFPVQALSDAGERDRVDVVRMSPLDAHLLHAPDGGDKLQGVAVRHFGAFFKREARENDYLWGRLDAAEILLGLLLADTELVYGERCADAFGAILSEEEASLATLAPLIRGLRSQLEPLRELSRLAAERLARETLELEPRGDFAAELNRLLGRGLALMESKGSENGGASGQEQAAQSLATLLDAVASDPDTSPRRRFAKRKADAAWPFAE